MTQTRILIMIAIAFVYFSCTRNSSGPNEDFSIPTDDEMPKIYYSGNNHQNEKINYDLILEKGIANFIGFNYELQKVTEEHTIALPIFMWHDLRKTTNIEQLFKVTMDPRCGNFMEFINLEIDSIETGFGYSLSAPLEKIPEQINGATESVLGFVQQLRIIDNYCYQKVSNRD
ncbi:MAG: hypothetical protein DWQ05_20070 [Calditrichaeota bacterium]|nr:MAG: hypothetical protein DWQ05_20070 [Calditrichota bacterium]